MKLAVASILVKSLYDDIFNNALYASFMLSSIFSGIFGVGVVISLMTSSQSKITN